MSLLPLNAEWVGLPQSDPPCFFQEQSIQCGSTTLALEAPIQNTPVVLNSTYVIALLEDDVAPELQQVKTLMGKSPKLFLSQTDLNLPEIFPLPAEVRPLKTTWEDPYILIQTEEQIWWRSRTPGSAWRMKFGSPVQIFEGHFLIYKGTGDVLRKVNLKNAHIDWEIPLPASDVSDIDVGKTAGLMLELGLFSGKQRKAFWLNPKLGAWVHTSPPKTEVDKMVSPSSKEEACPKVPPHLPRYPSWISKNNRICFNYQTLIWESLEAKPVALEWDETKVLSFWKAWLQQIGTAKDLTVKAGEGGTVLALGNVTQKSSLEKIKWYLSQLCETETCGLDLQIKIKTTP